MEKETRNNRHFRLATKMDFAQIQLNYANARQLMAKNGNPTQWSNYFPTTDIVNEDLELHREVLLVTGEGSNERILAQFALCAGKDPSYEHIEGSWLDDDPYVTIHRMASSGVQRHSATDCLRWVIDTFGNVRIDTHMSNKAMRHVIESNGFTQCGLIHIFDRPEDTEETLRLGFQRHVMNTPLQPPAGNAGQSDNWVKVSLAFQPLVPRDQHKETQYRL